MFGGRSIRRIFFPVQTGGTREDKKPVAMMPSGHRLPRGSRRTRRRRPRGQQHEGPTRCRFWKGDGRAVGTGERKMPEPWKLRPWRSGSGIRGSACTLPTFCMAVFATDAVMTLGGQAQAGGRVRSPAAGSRCFFVASCFCSDTQSVRTAWARMADLICR